MRLRTKPWNSSNCVPRGPQMQRIGGYREDQVSAFTERRRPRRMPNNLEVFRDEHTTIAATMGGLAGEGRSRPHSGRRRRLNHNPPSPPHVPHDDQRTGALNRSGLALGVPVHAATARCHGIEPSLIIMLLNLFRLWVHRSCDQLESRHQKQSCHHIFP